MTTNVNARRGDATEPPARLDAEKFLLGLFFVQRSTNCPVELKAADFLTDGNRVIYEHMRKIECEAKPLDAQSLCESLQEASGFDVSAYDDVGGFDYLRSLIERTPPTSPESLLRWGSIVKETSTKRTLWRIWNGLVEQSNNGKSAFSIIDDVKQQLDEIVPWSNELSFDWYDAGELDAAAFETRYYSKGFLAAGIATTVVAAPKSMKTNVVLDMGLSLASGTKILGEFVVNEPVAVGIMTGENQMGGIQDICRRQARAKGFDLLEIKDKFFVTGKLPKIGIGCGLGSLIRQFEDRGVELAILDPFYLAAATGGAESSIFSMGPLYDEFCAPCIDAGITPIVVHHTKRQTNNDELPNLFDAAWAGATEYFAQWFCLKRREPFDPDNGGVHKLIMTVGSRLRHSGAWGLDINEGRPSDNHGGTWECEVRKWAEVKQDARKAKVRDNAARLETEENDRLHLLKVQMSRSAEGEVIFVAQLRDATGMRPEVIKRGMYQLTESKYVEAVQAKGGNHKMTTAYVATKILRRAFK